MVWLKLAYKEFTLPFFFWKQEGCPGGKDFIWLTTLIIMVLTFTLFSWGSYKSMLNRFVDVLIGKVEGHGVPVSVMSNPYSKGGLNLITSEVLCATNKAGFEVYPLREVYSSFVELPDKDIWKINTPRFNGWAVYADDPLWRGSVASDNTLPLEIVINRSMFKKFFDYGRYREILKDKISKDTWETLPERLPEIDSPLEELWFIIRAGRGEELVPFKITWVNQITTLEKIAFLFPLSTYHALSYANRFPELLYFPEALGKGGKRFKNIMIEDNDNIEDINKIFSKLHGEGRTFRGDFLLTFKSAYSAMQIDSIANEHKLKYQSAKSVEGDIISHEKKGCKRNIWLSIERLPNDIISKDAAASCIGKGKCSIPIDVTIKGDGYDRAHVYISDPTKLHEAVSKIMGIHSNAYRLDPIYQDSLSRSGFLSKTVEGIRKPYGIIFGLFLLALLTIHITTIIGHRRHNYGIMLSKGIDWWMIYFMLFFQIFIAVIIGIGVSIGILYGTANYLQRLIVSISLNYTDILNNVQLDLLPLTCSDYIIATICIMIIAWLIAAIVLFFMPLRSKTNPSLLFQ